MIPRNAFCCCENHPPLFANIEFFCLRCACAAAYDKLAKWKFRIHGGIDGASYFVVWCVVAMDKLALLALLVALIRTKSDINLLKSTYFSLILSRSM